MSMDFMYIISKYRIYTSPGSNESGQRHVAPALSAQFPVWLQFVYSGCNFVSTVIQLHNGQPFILTVSVFLFNLTANFTFWN